MQLPSLKRSKLKKILSGLELSAVKSDDWSLWVEVRGDTFSSRVKDRRPAGDIFRLPAVQAACASLDLEAELSKADVLGLRYPLPEPFPVSDLCEIALTSADVSAANWLLSTAGLERVNGFMRSAGSRASHVERPFEELPETPQGQVALRDAVGFLRRAVDDPQQARWLRRNRRNPFISEWMPGEIDVWHQSGLSPYSVFDLSLIGDRPRWIMAVICENPSDPEATALHISHQGLRVRQALIEGGMIRSGI